MPSGFADVSSYAGPAVAATDHADQRPARPFRGVWHRRDAGPVQGRKIRRRLGQCRDPELARAAQRELAERFDACDQRNAALRPEIFGWHKANEAGRNLAAIPGIGPVTASLLAATVNDPKPFRNGPQMTAWDRARPPAEEWTGSAGSPRLATALSAAC